MKINSKIIILNGVSSSGKSTLSKELQKKLEEPYLHISVDKFLHMLPEDYINGKNIEGYRKNCGKVLKGMHFSCRELANTGNNLIIDHVLEYETHYNEIISLLKDHTVYFIGVHCSLKELERREKARGDRDIGLARKQLESIHKDKTYDIEVDTSKLNINEVINIIIDGLNKKPIALEKFNTDFR